MKSVSIKPNIPKVAAQASKKVQPNNDQVFLSVPVDSAVKEYLLVDAKRQNMTLAALVRECIITSYPELQDTNLGQRDAVRTIKRRASQPVGAVKQTHTEAVKQALAYFQ
jgi:hypothetical protein